MLELILAGADVCLDHEEWSTGRGLSGGRGSSIWSGTGTGDSCGDGYGGGEGDGHGDVPTGGTGYGDGDGYEEDEWYIDPVGARLCWN